MWVPLCLPHGNHNECSYPADQGSNVGVPVALSPHVNPSPYLEPGVRTTGNCSLGRALPMTALMWGHDDILGLWVSMSPCPHCPQMSSSPVSQCSSYRSMSRRAGHNITCPSWQPLRSTVPGLKTGSGPNPSKDCDFLLGLPPSVTHP